MNRVLPINFTGYVSVGDDGRAHHDCTAVVRDGVNRTTAALALLLVVLFVATVSEAVGRFSPQFPAGTIIIADLHNCIAILSNSKEIIEAYGAQVSVESQANSGGTFTLRAGQ